MATQTVLHVFPGAEVDTRRRGDDLTVTIGLRDSGLSQVMIYIPCDVAEQLCGRITAAIDAPDE